MIDGQLYSHTECYDFHHYVKVSYQLPAKQPIEINVAMVGGMLIQNGNLIKKTWITFDGCSTYSVTKQLDYVEDVNNCAKHEELRVLTNGGSLLFDITRRLNILPLNVHVNDSSLATIISLKM